MILPVHPEVIRGTTSNVDKHERTESMRCIETIFLPSLDPLDRVLCRLPSVSVVSTSGVSRALLSVVVMRGTLVSCVATKFALVSLAGGGFRLPEDVESRGGGDSVGLSGPFATSNPVSSVFGGLEPFISGLLETSIFRSGRRVWLRIFDGLNLAAREMNNDMVAGAINA